MRIVRQLLDYATRTESKKLSSILTRLERNNSISDEELRFIEVLQTKPRKPLGPISDYKKIRIIQYIHSRGRKNQHDLQRIPGENTTNHDEIVLLLQELIQKDGFLVKERITNTQIGYSLTDAGRQAIEQLRSFRDANPNIKLKIFEALDDFPF